MIPTDAPRYRVDFGPHSIRLFFATRKMAATYLRQEGLHKSSTGGGIWHGPGTRYARLHRLTATELETYSVPASADVITAGIGYCY